MEEAREERACLFTDSEREGESISDGEKLSRDEGERLEVVAVVDDEFEDRFPTFIW
jgi:hypothetical protein